MATGQLPLSTAVNYTDAFRNATSLQIPTCFTFTKAQIQEILDISSVTNVSFYVGIDPNEATNPKTITIIAVGVDSGGADIYAVGSTVKMFDFADKGPPYGNSTQNLAINPVAGRVMRTYNKV